jgi:hypothetical protein
MHILINNIKNKEIHFTLFYKTLEAAYKINLMNFNVADPFNKIYTIKRKNVTPDKIYFVNGIKICIICNNT